MSRLPGSARVYRYGAKALRRVARRLEGGGRGRTEAVPGLDAGGNRVVQYVLFAYPELAGVEVPMGDVVYHPFNLDPTEQFCLAALARARNVRRIFEFGTFDGATSALLARAVPEARIVTLDLPEDQVAGIDAVADRELRRAGGVGSKFKGRAEGERITQLLGDSRTFDFEPYRGTMDLVLVDGGHSYECVRSDSLHALDMLAPGGMVVWDDYCPPRPGWTLWPEVLRAVDEVATEMGITIVHVPPTEFAVYDRSRPA